MKNVIIFGCPRAGKTTLAKRLNRELSYNIISIDSIVTAFQNAFPEMGIGHYGDIKEKSKRFSPFLYEYLERAVWEYTDRNFVLEGWHNLPDYFMPLIDRNKYTIVCLGYPEVDIEKRFKEIRENDTLHDNTINTPDEELKKLICKSKQESCMLQEQCKKWNIPFFETNYNREKVLDEAFEYIRKHG